METLIRRRILRHLILVRTVCLYPVKRMLDFLFLVDERIKDPNTAINGPSSARQRNAIEMAFRWRADGGSTLNAGFVAL